MRNVLLVYKRSFLEKHREDPRFLARLGRPERDRLTRSDQENRRSLGEIHLSLLRRNLSVDLVYRGVVSRRKKYDLVVTVGGDGTFFLASHFVEKTPILGVNSDPEFSLGLHCGATRADFEEVLDCVLAGRAKVTALNRLFVEVNGRRFPSLVINDLLFADRNPAAMTRYRLSVDGRTEVQRSSGLWIATASGSTAAIRAAGGKRMPLTSQRIQYLVREPYPWPRVEKLVRGEARREISIECLTPESALWIDGAKRTVELDFGDRVTIRTGAPPLLALHLDEKRRARLFP